MVVEERSEAVQQAFDATAGSQDALFRQAAHVLDPA